MFGATASVFNRTETNMNVSVNEIDNFFFFFWIAVFFFAVLFVNNIQCHSEVHYKVNTNIVINLFFIFPKYDKYA